MSLVAIAISFCLIAVDVCHADLVALNQLLVQKETSVQQLVNATQTLFQARCNNTNLCVATSTQCTQPACGSGFLNTPGLMCDMNFGSNKSLCGKRCSGMLRSVSSSTLQVAPGATTDQQAATFTCSTASLTSLFRDLYYNQGVTGWQYVASNTGVTRTYPAAAQSASQCAKQDQRQQAWYVSASTGPKDIIFVCDFSDSMNAGDAGPNGMTRLQALKITMNLLLTSLTDADRFNVVTFNTGAKVVVPGVGLLSGSNANISLVNGIIQPKTTNGGTQYGPAFQTAFNLFANSGNTSSGCTRLLMFLTDGQPTDGNAYISALANGQALLGNSPALVFTYSISYAANENLLRDVACQYNGYWAPVRDGSAPNNPVQMYYNWIAQGILKPRPRWTNPTTSSWGQGPIVTVSQPMFDYSVTPKVFIGVAAIDVLMSELLAVATNAEILLALKQRSEVCLDYDLSPCQRQNLRLNSTVAFSCPSPEPPPNTCTTTSVKPPSCNTTIVTNINQVLCEPYNNYSVVTRNDSNFQCCQQLSCLTKSHSLTGPSRTPTRQISVSHTRPTKTPLQTRTVDVTNSATEWMSNTVTDTKTLRISVSRSAVLTQTALLTPTVLHNTTRSVSPTTTKIVSATVNRKLSGTAAPNATVTGTETLTVSPSRTLPRTPTSTSALTMSVNPTPSATWECIPPLMLMQAFNYTLTTFTVWDTDVVSGFNRSFSLPPLPGLESRRLHMKWFEPFTVHLLARLRPTTPPNANGFETMPDYTARISLTFVNGIGISTFPAANHETLVTVLCPPHPGFEIFTGEAVELQLDASMVTFGALCSGDASTPTSLTMFLMLVNTPSSVFVDGGQSLITVSIVAGGFAAAALGAAAPDMQVLIMTVMIPCANSFQKRSFQLFRAISPFAISDSFEGVLWGNLIANIGFLSVHGAVLLVTSVLKGQRLSEAAATVWFPNLSLQMMIMTYPGTAFSTGQVFIEHGRTSQSLFLAVVMLVVFVIGYPLGVMIYIMRNVEASYDRFEYHRWRRDASGLRVRLLSRFLLPVGSWDPPSLRRTYGTVITIQCRPEYVWITFPAWSALIVAILGLFDLDNKRYCIIIYAVMLLLHLLLILVVAYFKPFRSMIEDLFAVLALTFTSLFIVGTIVNLQLPSSQPAQTVLWVISILQVILLVVRVMYHVAHIFIARKLRDHVPHVEAFRWNMGYVDKNSEIGDGHEMLDALLKEGDPFGQQKMYAELDDLLKMNADDDDEGEKPDEMAINSHDAAWWKRVEEGPSEETVPVSYIDSLYEKQ